MRYCLIFVGIICASIQVAWGQESPHKNLKLACETCHVTTSFNEVTFAHDLEAFSLLGAHQQVECRSCHTIEDFSRVSRDCFSCHQDVHQARMGTDCQTCHSPFGWSNLDSEEIHSGSNFPMMGRHILLDCQSCHEDLPRSDFALTVNRCESCHQQDFLETRSPDHVAFGFSTDCQQCHQMMSWEPAFLPDHDGLFFPIYSGEHNNQWRDCATCHVDPTNRAVFSCVECHEHRQQEMDAKHSGIAGYSFNSTECYACHPTGEKGEFREHDSQFFPIFSGTHSGSWTACADCHTNTADRRAFECVMCHQHRQEVVDPAHQGITGYAFASTECYACHPTGEKGEFTDHDNLYFPIFSGAHRNRWESCQTCHTTPGNPQEFSCLNCHEHSQTRMDDKHLGEVQGYSYDSQACYDCHPNGRH